MDYIFGSRGTGKTHQLLYMAAKNNGIVVCSNPKGMQQKAKDYGFDLEKMQFLSYGQFAMTPLVEHKPVYIDEIDSFLRNSINSNIAGYTLSLE